ncbi:hypothetical protein B484DRAFT_405989 [Ochromonadaceae sp. CCMP2298]|nr:hypothetical protein B484DRAFT_405989 [Ochromonadaceae sp. CCMP2298]
MPTTKKRATKDPEMFNLRDANLANQPAQDIAVCTLSCYLLCGNCHAIYDKNKGANRLQIQDRRGERFFVEWGKQARKMVEDFKAKRGQLDKSPEAFEALYKEILKLFKTMAKDA